MTTMEQRNKDNLKIDVGGDVIDLYADLKIDTDDIKQSYLDQPAKYAWWATQLAKASYLVDQKKLAVSSREEYLKSVLWSQLDQEVRAQFDINKEKATEAKISSAIRSDPRYVEALNDCNRTKMEYLKAKDNYNIMLAARDAMEHRKEMLISIGAQMRYEDAGSQPVS